MKPLKVLFTIDSLGRGGTERSLAELLPHLMQANITPLIAYFHSYTEGVEQEVRDSGVETRLLNQHKTFARVYKLRQIIASWRPDLIHTATFASDLAGRLAAVGTTIPVISSLVSTPYTEVRFQDPNINRRKLRMVQAIDTWGARHLTTHFHAVSHTARDAAINTMGIAQQCITVIPRGRNAERLGRGSCERRQTARAKLQLGANETVLITVGRHEYPKGHSYLITAMPKLVNYFPQLKLLIAGREGVTTPELKQLCAQAGLNDKVRFLGHRNDIPDLLAAADLFVFPSLYEGLPGAVIEAMALSLPIVASNIGPVQEVVEDGVNALLVTPKSAVQLATAIHSLLNDSVQMRAFGKRSRAIFEERFKLERSAAQMVELYQKVVANGR